MPPNAWTQNGHVSSAVRSSQRTRGLTQVYRCLTMVFELFWDHARTAMIKTLRLFREKWDIFQYID